MAADGRDAPQDPFEAEFKNARAHAVRPSVRPYALGLTAVFVLQILAGMVFVPPAIIRISGVAPPALVIRAGYGLGLFAVFSIPVPLLVSILALFSKSRRNVYSFIKTYFWTALAGLAASVAIHIAYVPMAIR